VLAVHISNRFLDLEPVVLGEADLLDLGTAVITVEDNEDTGLLGSTWVLVTANRALLECEAIQKAADPPSKNSPARIVWTDDYSALLPIVKVEWNDVLSTLKLDWVLPSPAEEPEDEQETVSQPADHP
jgi:hypothetical protein